MSIPDDVLALLKDAKSIARKYYELTGRPMGITGEVAECEAARILGVELAGVRQPGYDGTYYDSGKKKRVQIKGRRLADNPKPGQRLGSIQLKKEWDSVLLVLLDKYFEAFEIWEAERPAIEVALTIPGSKARNERGALGVSKFKSIGTLRWRRST